MIKEITLLSIIYIIILICQWYYLNININKYKALTENKLNNNNSELETKLNNRLKQIMTIFENSKDVSLKQFIDYVNKNKYVKLDSGNYYFFIYQKLNDDYLNLINQDPNKEFLTWTDILEEYKNISEFSHYSIQNNLIDNMYHLVKNKESNKIKYYRVDNKLKSVVKKISICSKWEIDNIKGIIGIGYNIGIINNEANRFYYYLINKKIIILVSISTFLLSVVLLLSNSKFLLLAIFNLIILNFFIIKFVLQREVATSVNKEIEQLNNIKSNILSIAFLGSIIIFILDKVELLKSSLHKYTLIVFSVQIILILISLFVNPYYTILRDVEKERITKQLIYNMSIILNLSIIFAFIFLRLFE